MLLHRCLHCLAAGACELKYDWNGAPFTSCRFCRSRTFLKSLEALRGVAIVPQLVESVLRLRDEGKAPWVDKAIAELVADVRASTRDAKHPFSAHPEIVPFVGEKVA